MSAHKCDGCRYRGEHQEMGFKPFGVCFKETNLIEAEKNYKAEICPYKFALPQLYEIDDVDLAEEEPAPWPKENPHLKPALNISAVFEPLIKGLAVVAVAFDKMIKEINKNLPIIAKLVTDISETALNLYPNKRVIHLAKHGKPRTRKKNINRITKWIAGQGKKPSPKRSSRGYITYTERDGRKCAVFRTE